MLDWPAPTPRLPRTPKLRRSLSLVAPLHCVGLALGLLPLAVMLHTTYVPPQCSPTSWHHCR